LIHAPVTAFALAAGALGLAWKTLRRGSHSTLLIGLCFVFFLGVALVVPNTGGKQWGPRYLLPMLPLISLLVATSLHVLLGHAPRWGARRYLDMTRLREAELSASHQLADVG
jgi:peptidoglycan/LPS O-acetylase OafA/YrhL